LTNTIVGVDTYTLTITDNGWNTNAGNFIFITTPSGVIGPIPVGVKIILH
jgi:hypothetical protein